MFDFHISLAADHLETKLPDLLEIVLGPLDSSVDPLLFDDIPLNHIDLP